MAPPLTRLAEVRAGVVDDLVLAVALAASFVVLFAVTWAGPAVPTAFTSNRGT